MNASNKKQAITAVLALLAIVAAGMIVWKEIYASSPDRLWDQARAARAAGHSLSHTPPTPAKDAPAKSTAHKSVTDEKRSDVASPEPKDPNKSSRP